MLRPSARLACLLSLLLIAGVGAPAVGATAPSGASHGVGGGKAWLTQFGSAGVPFDQDYACAAG